MGREFSVDLGKHVEYDSLAAQDHRVVRCSMRGLLVEALRILHDLTEESKCIMFDMVGVVDCTDYSVLAHRLATLAQIHSISFNHPQHGRQQLVHTLSVPQIRIQLAEDEEDVQHHALCVRLAEV